MEGNEVIFTVQTIQKEMKTIHGTTSALLLNNMVIGVSEGFKKELEMRGWLRAQLQGSKLVLAVGKSHPDEVEVQRDYF